MKRVLNHRDPPTWNRPLLLTEVEAMGAGATAEETTAEADLAEEAMATEEQVTVDTGEEVTDTGM
jgi:hypothetical protein